MPAISYQLYSSRNWDVEETFKMLAELNVKEVEGFGPYLDDPERTRTLLDEHGMAMPTAHFALDLVEKNPEEAIAIAKTIGINTIFVPFLAPDDRPTTAEGWRAFAARLASAGVPIVEAGLKFGWHNHEFELIPVDGIMPLDVIAEASDDIMIELDLAWVKVSGQDPVEWLKKYAGRVAAAHVKDIAPTGENADEDGWADVGHGTMNWPEIKAAMDAADVQRYIIEHDNPSDHKRMASRSLASVQAF
ncbi:sugar phosphate isomerase/epimerase family protein [Shimia abyssi]|uniref:Sugar phosphate isomerase/epimerase n=1 Tax=Shimia abyssi TaxID=1662395 RepID=A0A2P8F6X6_9RHOB|nr:sugar phosphate isomerase/epimerase [Shimia abyssi]PSL17475.1 sugar phosphate isomerase/epimerase [Shimia abyssi]